MKSYLVNIKIALIFFPIIAALITLPIYIHQYRKFGFVNKLRMLTTYAFMLYMICAYFQVILPLPGTRDIVGLLGTQRELYRLELFASIKDIIRETSVSITSPSTYLHIIKERAFLQLIFNIVITIPFGVFMRYLFNKKFMATVLFSFFLSTFFELSQLTGLFGIYNAPYRLFEIDDFIWNTLGGIIGYVITPIITYFIPKLDDIDKESVLPSQVGLLRRLAALVVDWNVVDIAVNSITSFGNLNDWSILIYSSAIILYFAMIPCLTNGYTLGKFLLGIRLDFKGAKVLKLMLLRTSSFYLAVFGVNLILNYILQSMQDDPIILISSLIAFVLYNILLIFNFLFHIKDRIFFHDRLSQIQNIIAKEK